MAYNIDTSKATVPEALEILTDAVLNPKFQSWEVAEQVGVGGGGGGWQPQAPAAAARQARGRRCGGCPLRGAGQTAMRAPETSAPGSFAALPLSAALLKPCVRLSAPPRRPGRCARWRRM
jgi:hypothetical protein